MSDVKRYDCYGKDALGYDYPALSREAIDGDWVLAEDHIAECDALRARLAEAERERDDHWRWRKELADTLDEVEKHRDATAKALNKRENDLMALLNVTNAMMALLGYHGSINALRKVVQAYETLRSEAEEWECDGLGLFAQHGWWESVDEAIDLLNSEYRPCTCHPDDSPPNPCPQKFALSECVTAAVHDNNANVIVQANLASTLNPHPSGPYNFQAATEEEARAICDRERAANSANPRESP